MSEQAGSGHDDWIALRDEVWACRETADVARRYFRSRANRYRLLEIGLAIASLMAQSAGVVAVFDTSPVLALLLTVLASALTAVGLALRYGDRRAEHQLAARTANEIHNAWSRIWREVASGAPTRAAMSGLRKQVDETLGRVTENMNSINEGIDSKLWREKELEVRAAFSSHEVLNEEAAVASLASAQEDRSSGA